MNRLETALNILEIGLRINAPAEVKEARFFFDYKGLLEDDPNVGYGIIYLYVETNSNSFVLEYNQYWVQDLNDIDNSHAVFAESLIEDEDYLKVWEDIDFERECWKWE